MEGISVIICCFNSENRIEPTLQHLLRQNFGKDWEIVLVDNNSNDNTVQTALEILKNNVVSYTIVEESNPGLIHARKKGIGASKYKYLLFCDDDNWLCADYLNISYEIFDKNPSIGVIGGNGRAHFEDESNVEKKIVGLAINPQGKSSGDITDYKGHVYGAGSLFKKEIFHKLDKIGFKPVLTGRKGDKLLAGDDTELCFAARILGYKIYYHEGLKFEHYIPKFRTSDDYLKKLHEGFKNSFVYLEVYSNFIAKKKHNWIVAFVRALIVKSIDVYRANGLWSIFTVKNKAYILLMENTEYKKTYIQIRDTFNGYI